MSPFVIDGETLDEIAMNARRAVLREHRNIAWSLGRLALAAFVGFLIRGAM